MQELEYRVESITDQDSPEAGSDDSSEDWHECPHRGAAVKYLRKHLRRVHGDDS